MLAEQIEGAKTFKGALNMIVTRADLVRAGEDIVEQVRIGNNATQAAVFAAETGDVIRVAAIIKAGNVHRPFGKGLMVGTTEFTARIAERFSIILVGEEAAEYRNTAAEARRLGIALDRLPV